MTKFKYINNIGGGFNETREVPDQTTCTSFFASVMPGAAIEDYKVRVNNRPLVEGQVLRNDDRLSIIPSKYDGGTFGRDFVANLKAAAELGRLARATPDLADDLRAINELGAAIKAVPDLAANIGAVIAFVGAVKAFDETPAEHEGTLFTAAQDDLFDAVEGVEGDLLALLKDAGGVAGLKARLATLDRPVATPRPFPRNDAGAPDIPPGHFRLATGGGLGRDEPLLAGETIGQLFARLNPGQRPESYRIEVNGADVGADDVLVEGDSVEIVRLVAARGRPASGSCGF
jgi:sulfur carrier protein ThiS